MDLSKAQWRKSDRSKAEGQCVEVALLPTAGALRDSKNADGGSLIVPLAAIRALLGQL